MAIFARKGGKGGKESRAASQDSSCYEGGRDR